MRTVDFTRIVRKAWEAYDPYTEIVGVTDVSPHVSTNYVFKLNLQNEQTVFAKLSYYGKFEHFLEDHSIINNLARELPPPFENFLARSLTTDNEELFIYRLKEGILDAWVVFYNPIPIKKKLPRRLDEHHIKKLGSELAKFHRACQSVSDKLPPSSKTLHSDINDLLERLHTDRGKFEYRGHIAMIRRQCDTFLQNVEQLGYEEFSTLPIFLDWNIGNFSVTEDTEFYSRWDYDWFRICSRVLDFYFFSRVVSTVGDRTVFSYLVDPLMEERFLLFLHEYHQVYPLTENEVRFIREAFRFFILNYVVKDGRYFFHEIYALKLQQEAYEIYLPSIEQQFDAEKILNALKI